MSLYIVVGGQFGSEGKGKVAAHIVQKESIDICVRCGGPNSGHSFLLDNGERVLLRQLSVGVINPKTRLLIPAGAIVNLPLLFDEIKRFNLDASRVGIDKNATVLTEDDIASENQSNLGQRLSSTLSGTGAALSRRVMRTARTVNDIKFSESWLQPLVTNVASECNDALDVKKSVLIEGTQGFGLSLYHSEFYPKTTSRDTSAAWMLSEVGLSPLQVSEIICVFRTFPIRVAGSQAGPLNDITWEEVQKESGSPEKLEEYTSVTRRIRRVGRFDFGQALKAVKANRPTKIAMMGFDYINFEDRGKRKFQQLSDKSTSHLETFKELGHIAYLGTGPKLTDMIEL